MVRYSHIDGEFGLTFDWIFEGIITWVSSVVTDLMDAVSGLFLQALGTDMTAMEEYFPFVTKAFTVMQYTAWAILFLISTDSIPCGVYARVCAQ